MKKLIFIGLLFMQFDLHCQVNYFLTDADSAIWRFSTGYSPWPEYSEYFEFEYIMKDTTWVDNVLYRKLYVRNDNSQGNGELLCLLREDNAGKIWQKRVLTDVYYLGYVLLRFPDTDEEVLLYDFGMTEGGSMETMSGWSGNFTTTITSVIAENYFGANRHFYNLLIDPYIVTMDGQWIEGVGSTYNLLHSYLNTGVSAGVSNLCYTHFLNDSTYTMIFASACSSLNVAEESGYEDVAIFPNPASQFITVTSSVSPQKIVFRNCFGQQVLQSKERKMDISRLSAGIYFIEVIVNDRREVLKFVKE